MICYMRNIFSLHFVLVHPKLLTLCFKFIEKTDIFTKRDRKKDHWLILASRMNSGYLSHPVNSRNGRNTYTEPQYSAVELSDAKSKDVKKIFSKYDTSLLDTFFPEASPSHSFQPISQTEQILNPGRFLSFTKKES